jgi:hypothetical protein
MNTNGTLEILVSGDSAHADFDLYIGKWAGNRKLIEHLNSCTE